MTNHVYKINSFSFVRKFEEGTTTETIESNKPLTEKQLATIIQDRYNLQHVILTNYTEIKENGRND